MYTKKNGRLGGIQRYKCTECNNNFSDKKRPKRLQDKIFKEYFYKRQTYNDLAQTYGKCMMWIKGQIDNYIPLPKVHNPSEITLVRPLHNLS